MDFRAIIGVAAGIVAVAAMIPYIASILRGTTRPNRTSWLIWTIVALVLFSSYRGSGASDTIWLAAAYVAIPATILFFSFKFEGARPSPIEWACLTGALIGIAAWITLRSPPAALFICIAVDALGAIPTLRKAYREPRSENLAGWGIAFAAALLNLLAIEDWSPQISLYPLYAVGCAGLISLTLIIRQGTLAPRRAEGRPPP
jgi:hypothetical protein